MNLTLDAKEYTQSKINECYEILARMSNGEDARAYAWRQFDAKVKMWALNKCGYDVERARKPLHELSAAERLRMRRSIQASIAQMRQLEALLVGGK